MNNHKSWLLPLIVTMVHMLNNWMWSNPVSDADLFGWSGEFMVGNPVIDQEHPYLFILLPRLSDVMA